MLVFLQNAISFALLYSDFVWTNIQALYIQNSAIYLSDAWIIFFFFFFLQNIGIEKPRLAIRFCSTSAA